MASAGNPVLSHTFAYNGAVAWGTSDKARASFTVPDNVHHLTITAAGGTGKAGGAGYAITGQGGPGGAGGQVVETIAVWPGEVLTIQPGADGSHGGTAYGDFYGGMYGSGDSSGGNGGWGGGASVVLLDGQIVAVAGGGGGGGGGGAVAGYTGGSGGSGIRGAGTGGSGLGAGSAGSGSWGSTAGEPGENAGYYSYAGGGGGGGGGWNSATGDGGGSRGGGGSGGAGGGGGAAGGSSYAAPDATGVGFSEAPRRYVGTVYPPDSDAYGDPGWVTLSWQQSISTALSVPAGPTPYGRPVTLTDTLTPPAGGYAAATGTVTFTDQDLYGDPANTLATVPVVDGVARFTTTALGIGTHAIRAVYNGDSNYDSLASDFAYPQIGAPDTTLSLVPNPIAFGAHPVKTATTRTVTVTNTGSIPWQLTRVASDNASFSVPSGGCFAGPVQPGHSCTLTASFRPAVTGATSATLTLTSNFPAQSLRATGTGLPPAPAVTAISPRSGPAAGGTRVTVTGSNFIKVSAITIGTAALKKISCASRSTCTGVTPAGHHVHDIQVHTASGTSRATTADRFTYRG
jgi:hypothetical protein